MAYRKERFRLRFFGLSRETENEIRSALPGADFISRKSSLPPETDILGVELQEAMDLSALYSALDRLSLGTKQFEVIASVVTTSDNGGIDVPDYILKLIRRTQCGLGFSFVDVGPDDQDGADDDLQPASLNPQAAAAHRDKCARPQSPVL
jgi:hypothetical protein